MPFYLRKSFRLGPLRFNLSKSGVGMSAGVTGARVGTGPRGNYVHGGRGGLYYRKSLNANLADEVEDGPPAEQPAKPKDGLVHWLKGLFGGR